MSEPLTAREFLSLVDPSRPFIPELHEDDCDDVSCARCVKPASSTSAMDVPAAQLVADMRARSQQQAVELLHEGASRSHSPSDRIAYALDEWLVTHPDAPVSTDND
jgi:hypothetical protein